MVDSKDKMMVLRKVYLYSEKLGTRKETMKENYLIDQKARCLVLEKDNAKVHGWDSNWDIDLELPTDILMALWTGYRWDRKLAD